MKNLLLYLLIIILASGCLKKKTNTNVILSDIKWLMYCLNYKYCGIELGSIDGPPYYRSISCDFNLASIDSIGEDTVEIRFDVDHENERVLLVDTSDKRKQKVIYSNGKSFEMSYPNTENVVYGIQIINQREVLLIYHRSYVLTGSKTFNLNQLKDSLEINFISFGKMHVDEMTPWLKHEFVKRSN